jgi:hypothetical protein
LDPLNDATDPELTPADLEPPGMEAETLMVPEIVIPDLAVRYVPATAVTVAPAGTVMVS